MREMQCVLQQLWMTEEGVKEVNVHCRMCWERLWVEEGAPRRTWGVIKKRFQGEGGYRRYMITIGALLRLGALAGRMEEGWAVKEWWQQSMQRAEEVRAEWEEWMDKMRTTMDYRVDSEEEVDEGSEEVHTDKREAVVSTRQQVSCHRLREEAIRTQWEAQEQQERSGLYREP